MKIQSVSSVFNYRPNKLSFKANEPKPLVRVSNDTPDRQVVAYGTWGPNYAFPIYAKDVKQAAGDSILTQAPKVEEKAQDNKVSLKPYDVANEFDNSPEALHNRKIYSAEWST